MSFQKIAPVSFLLTMIIVIMITVAIFSETPESSLADSQNYRLSAEQATDPERLKEELQAIIDGTSGTWGIYIHEPLTGRSIGINEDELFPGASTSKVPLLAKLYHDMEEGAVRRDAILAYQPGDYENGTGSIQFGPTGGQWRIDNLANKMAKESDNVAQNMLLRYIGLENVQAYAESLGMSNTDLRENLTTPRDMGTLFGLIHKNRIASAALSAEMLDLMTNTRFENRIPRYLVDVKVSHKIGQWEGAVSDVGIVFLEDQPFILCVYSRNTATKEEAEETIGRLARAVYDYEVLVRSYRQAYGDAGLPAADPVSS